MGKTKIEWCDLTVNPVVGCSACSPGCLHCYAARVASRGLCPAHKGLARGGEWTGEVRWNEGEFQRLVGLARARKGRRVFVGSMTDLFHPNVPDEWRDKIFAAMALAPKMTFMVLTKRHKGMRGYLTRDVRPAAVMMEADKISGGRTPWAGGMGGRILWPLANVWLGVTAENQAMADLRVPVLLDTPAAVRFASVEPMLGPVNLTVLDTGRTWPGRSESSKMNALAGHSASHRNWSGIVGDPASPLASSFVDHENEMLDWVICGGESGPGARPVYSDWVRGVRDECAGAGVPFFFKQWGEFLPDEQNPKIKGKNKVEGGIRVGKKAAGRLLDGREWNEFPGEDPS